MALMVKGSRLRVKGSWLRVKGSWLDMSDGWGINQGDRVNETFG